MELYRVGLPEEEKIIARDKFIVDNIIPICIKKLTEDQYSILFFAEQDSTETSIFLQSIIALTDESDKGFLNNHPLNINSIRRDKNRLEFYNEKINSMKGNVYNTDFDMDEYEEDRHYFKANSSKPIYIQSTKEPQAFIMDLLITRDNFIKISLFITKFLNKDTEAESIFISRKLKNIKFDTITQTKLDGSTINKITNIVHSHYTLGHGPTMYKMNFISPYVKGRKLRNPMIADHYLTFFGDDFLISNIIFDYHRDRIFIIYEVRSSVTNQFKETVALILNKDIYSRTNFVNLNKIYED